MITYSQLTNILWLYIRLQIYALLVIIIIIPHFRGFDHEKTKGQISTKLSHELGHVSTG